VENSWAQGPSTKPKFPDLRTRVPVLVSCILKFSAGHPASVPYVAMNDCHCCAERRLLKILTISARKTGVRNVAHWIHRKFGDLVVFRERKDGLPGSSFPCVLCRKILDRNSIQWRAHVDTTWYRSNDPDLPKSRPTQRQRYVLGWN
jgi:hypothetical protein